MSWAAVAAFWSDYTLRTVAAGAAVIGATAGVLGVFAQLRRQSLLGDAVSHAALPGIALVFLLTGSKAPAALVAGAAVTGWLGALCVTGIVRSSRVTADSALGLVLSVFFGAGLMLLTWIQRRPDASQAGLDRFLFGQAATLLAADVATMAALGGGAVLVLVLLWKEFKLLSFDPAYAALLGLPVRRLDILLTGLLVAAVVAGLQAVGVVLMSAMLVAPAAAARQWTDRLAPMAVLAACFGAAAGVGGAVASSLSSRTPTGPAVVLAATAIVLASLILAPRRGLLAGAWRRWRRRRDLRLHAILLDLHALAAQHGDPTAAPHAVAVLRAMAAGGSVRRSLRELTVRGWAADVGGDLWTITADGRAEAERFLADRAVDGAREPGEARGAAP